MERRAERTIWKGGKKGGRKEGYRKKEGRKDMEGRTEGRNRKEGRIWNRKEGRIWNRKEEGRGGGSTVHRAMFADGLFDLWLLDKRMEGNVPIKECNLYEN
jgi:hypothetical protein